jgi:hypothetical protein
MAVRMVPVRNVRKGMVLSTDGSTVQSKRYLSASNEYEVKALLNGHEKVGRFNANRELPIYTPGDTRRGKLKAKRGQPTAAAVRAGLREDWRHR